MSYSPGPRVDEDGLRGLRDYLVRSGATEALRDDPGHGWRADHLVVARESDEFASQLLEGMVLQTLHRYDQIAGRDDLVRLGIGPVLDPAAHGAIVIESGGSRAVLFQRAGSWCLYSQGSAAKADADGDNGFCRILVRVFEELRPRAVYLASFSRLVRNTEFAGPVMAAAREHVDTIHCREMPLPMQDGNSRFFFSFLSALADMERTQQMVRLILGLLAKHDRGEWLRGKEAVPLGYRLVDRKVVPDARARHVVRRVVDLLGAPGSTSLSVARGLADLEVATPNQTGTGWAYLPEGGGEWTADDPDLRDALASSRASGKTLQTVHYPAGIVRKFYGNLGLYADGRLRTTHVAPVRAARLGRHPVLNRRDAEGKIEPYVELVYEPGVPDGGWTPADALARAQARAREIASHAAGPLANSLLLPLLAGAYRWSDAGRLYALSNGRGQSNSYAVISIDLVKAETLGSSRPGKPFNGWDRGGKFHGRIDARVEAADLHRSLAEAAAAALGDGVDVRFLPHPGDWPDRPQGLPGTAPAPDPTAEFAAGLAQARKLAARAATTYNAYVGDDEEHNELLREQSEQASARVRRAKERLEAAERDGQDPDAPPPPQQVTGSGELLLAVLSRLGHTPGAVPRAVAEAVGRIVHDVRVDPGALWADWSATLHVPRQDGILVLGPLTGRVRNRLSTHYDPAVHGAGPRENHKGVRLPEHMDAVLTSLLGAGTPVRDLLNRNGDHGRGVRLAAVARLQEQPYGMARNAAETLLTCPVDATRRAVWAMLNEREPDPSLPPGFADHLRRTYLQPPGPTVRKWWVYVRDRTPVNELLLAAGGAIPSCQAKQAFRDADIPDWLITHLVAPSSPHRHLLRIPNPDGKTAGCCQWLTCRTDLLSLVPCPHCGGWATLTVKAPEVPRGLLCPDCLRMPVPNSPAFPPEYLLLNDGWVQDRQHDVAPDLSAYRGKDLTRKLGSPARDLPQPGQDHGAARAWAAQNGIRLKTGQPVPGWVLARWVEDVARLDTQSQPPAAPPPSRRTADIRSWARAVGIDVPARGRLPHAVWAAYEAALPT